MRSSLRTITEISLAGQAVDAYNVDPGIKFRVNCDSLSWLTVKYYDNDSGDSFAMFYPKGGEMTAKHNGEIFSGTLWSGSHDVSPFLLGHDYTAIFTCFQNYPESSANPLNTGEGKYDVYLGGGVIQQDSTDPTEIYIDKGITSIKSPETYGDRTIGGCMLKIGNVSNLIQSYNSSTGCAKINSYSGIVAHNAGEEYKLISNYLECEPFVFYCRSGPDVTLTAERTEDGLTVSGNYSQAEDVAMQSYQFELNSGQFGTIDQSEKKFTYTFSHVFPFDDFKQYKGTVDCTVTTQDNFSKEFSADIPLRDIDGTAIEYINITQESPLKTVIKYKTSVKGKFLVFREDENGNDIFVGVSNAAIADREFTFTDYTAGSGQSYIYRLCGCIDGKVYGKQAEAVKLVDGRSCIARLTEATDSYGRKAYRVGKSFTFDCDVDCGTVETNLGNSYSLTDSAKPKIIYGGDRFDTGTFTATLETLDSDTLTLTSGYGRIRAWTDFISQQGLFLLKSGDGDVKIVAITSNPSRTYGTDVASLGITKISYGWAEVTDIDRALLT